MMDCRLHEYVEDTDCPLCHGGLPDDEAEVDDARTEGPIPAFVARRVRREEQRPAA